MCICIPSTGLGPALARIILVMICSQNHYLDTILVSKKMLVSYQMQKLLGGGGGGGGGVGGGGDVRTRVSLPYL